MCLVSGGATGSGVAPLRSHTVEAASTVAPPIMRSEAPDNAPIARHYDNDYAGSYKFVGAVPGSHLVVRVSSTVYNYDCESHRAQYL